ncbi:MAG: Uma2 family endonuclease [Anaerolineae bacterium]|nr:Uma2 family endonuclease [Anaerolineae bacterium]
MDVQTRIGMPLDEFIREYDKAPFELVNGERIPVVPTGAIHTYIIKKLLQALFAYEEATQAGQTFPESVFIRFDVPNWVKGSRVPDISFYTQSRWDEYLSSMPDWEDKPFVLIPDLCVEVVSKTDNYDDVDDKVAEYLAIGVQMVWVIKPRTRTITVHVADRVLRLTASDLLTGGDVLPSFSVPVADVFPKA